MLQKRLLTLVLASAIMSAAVPKAGALESAEVNIWLSTVNSTDTGMDKALSNEDSVYFVADNGERISNLIIVDESKEYQVIDGFGGSITEASAHLYQDVLDSDEQDDVMNALFDVETGIGISMLRQTIGASDHCVAPYNLRQSSRMILCLISIFHMSLRKYSRQFRTRSTWNQVVSKSWLHVGVRQVG